MSQRKPIEIIQVDSFTAEPFGGNPAGVCILDGPVAEKWMQNVAAEMNLSETAFLWPENDEYRLRWFTPAVEVELCGHATLASAHVLWESGKLPPDQQARFITLSGSLTATKRDIFIELDFPSVEPSPVFSEDALLKILGVRAKYVGNNGRSYLVEVESETVVRGCRPDFTALRKLGEYYVMITSRSDNAKYDFVSRFFAPAAGIDEDPVTGSAHCTLGPYWAAKLGKKKLTAFQASARGGEVHIAVEGSRILLSGRAVTVMRCELLV